MNLSKKQLQAFSEEEHHKHKIQAIVEASVALLPLFVLSIGFGKLLSVPTGVEKLSPANFGFLQILLVLLTMSYVVFLYFIIKDIKKRLAIK